MGQRPEDLGRRERDVEKEADPGARQPPAEQLRHQHELVVVHPDQVPLAIHLGHRVGEALVDRPVDRQVLGAVGHRPGEVVEDRPDEPVGEAVVVPRHLLLGEEDRREVIEAEPLGQRGALLLGEVGGGPGPAEPPASAPQVRAAESVGQPAVAPLQLEPVHPAADRHGEPVRDHDHPGVHHVHALTRPSRASSSSPIVMAAWTRPTWV